MTTAAKAADENTAFIAALERRSTPNLDFFTAREEAGSAAS
jgi:hypothetical protein